MWERLWDRVGLLFDTSDFPARWDCGNWTPLHGWIHIIADIAIWAAYVSIPCTIVLYVLRRREVPMPRLFWLFAAFIFFCGTTHLMEAVIYWWPAYRLNAVFKILTAVASIATVVVLMGQLPQLLRFPNLSTLNQRLVRESEARAAVERTLIERSNLLQLALAAGKAGAWSYDFASQRLTRHPSLSRLLGLPENLTTETQTDWRNRIAPEDRELAGKAVDEAFAQGRSFEVQYRVVRPSGELCWVTSRGDVVRDDQGRAIGFAGIVADISNERQAAESRARLAAIMQNAPDAILAQSLDGTVTDWNRGATKLYDWTAEEMVGQPIHRLVPNSRRSEVDEYLALAAKGESVGPFETVRKARDGRLIPIELVATPVIAADGRVLGVSTIGRDLSYRVDSERQLRSVNRTLKHRNDEMEQFLYSVSHDLKAPLVTIIGFSGAIVDELEDSASPAVADAVARIERAAARMTNLIDDLLEVSRIGRVAHRPATTDVSAMVQEIATDFAETLSAQQVQLVASDPPPVHADPMRLRQVLDNLVTNALKYGCPDKPATIEVGGARLAGAVRLYVRDHGPGVPEAHREKVFQLFQRLDLQAEGTGLGLALVRRILQMHGGSAWLDETPGGGSTVWLEFPEEKEQGDGDDTDRA